LSAQKNGKDKRSPLSTFWNKSEFAPVGSSISGEFTMPNKATIFALLATAPAACVIAMAQGAQADEVIMSTTSTSVPVPVTTSSSSTLLVEDTKGVQFKFKERLANIQQQLDRGVDNKWISVGQAAAFKTERSRLCDLTSQVEAEGWPKDKVDSLEKDVTALSAKVSTAASNGGPKAPTPLTEESGAPLAK
jgi:hypothetical protein